jgi:hypothetical protein
MKPPVYLPSCRALLDEPDKYLLDALKLTFYHQQGVIDTIVNNANLKSEPFDRFKSMLQDCKDLGVKFILDQYNAFNSPRLLTTFPDANPIRVSFQAFPFVCTASANDDSYLNVAKQEPFDYMFVSGGLTEVRLAVWLITLLDVATQAYCVVCQIESKAYFKKHFTGLGKEELTILQHESGNIPLHLRNLEEQKDDAGRSRYLETTTELIFDDLVEHFEKGREVLTRVQCVPCAC